MERDIYTIATGRLGLRTWLPTDIIPFAEMNADPEVMRFFPKQLSRLETENFIGIIEKHFQDKGYGLFAVDMMSTGEFIGFIGLHTATFISEFTPCVEVGWRLRRRFWGNGYATEGAAACLGYGFGQLGLTEICSFTSAVNGRSVAVMKRIGLRYRMDFGHPKIDPENELFRHVLYGLTQTEYEQQRSNK
jgi:RimJ/RimL family protein N-acetyltransferase